MRLDVAMNDQSKDPRVAQASAMASELRVIISRLRRRTREARPGDLTESQLLALSRLDRQGPATVTTLARAEGIRPQSMGANVTVLEAEGLVSRAPDPSDGRQSILSLTPAADELIKRYRAARTDWLFRAITTKLTAQEQSELASSLELMKRLIDL
jgi:DNA-binding MarR family transcriptional regulator